MCHPSSGVDISCCGYQLLCLGVRLHLGPPAFPIAWWVGCTAAHQCVPHQRKVPGLGALPRSSAGCSIHSVGFIHATAGDAGWPACIASPVRGNMNTTSCRTHTGNAIPGNVIPGNAAGDAITSWGEGWGVGTAAPPSCSLRARLLSAMLQRVCTRNPAPHRCKFTPTPARCA